MHSDRGLSHKCVDLWELTRQGALRGSSLTPPPHPQPREPEGELHNGYVRALDEIVDGAHYFPWRSVERIQLFGHSPPQKIQYAAFAVRQALHLPSKLRCLHRICDDDLR